MRPYPSLILLASVVCLACAKGSSIGGAGGDTTASSSGSPSSTSTGSSSTAGSGGTGSGGTGGTAAGAGGAGGGMGTGGCTMGTNTDGDGMDDCAETGDGDPWTDPAIFNGMHVRWAEQCSPAPSCALIDTLAEVDACVASVPLVEQQDQYSGWDWIDPADNICSALYNFQPPWKQCNDINAIRWQADWQGYINLTKSGKHCFGSLGVIEESCAVIFFNTETTGITQLSGTACYDVPAGKYPIRWHYEMDNGSDSDMHIIYCFGGAMTCSPAIAIPANMLLVSP